MEDELNNIGLLVNSNSLSLSSQVFSIPWALEGSNRVLNGGEPAQGTIQKNVQLLSPLEPQETPFLCKGSSTNEDTVSQTAGLVQTHSDLSPEKQ